MIGLLVIFDSSNVDYLVGSDVCDSSNVLVRFVWLVSDDSSNVLDVYVVYVSMYEGQANYQYYALQGSE